MKGVFIVDYIFSLLISVKLLFCYFGRLRVAVRMVLPLVFALLPLDPILNIFPPGVAGGCPIGEVAPNVEAFAIALPNENEAAGAGVC